MQIPGKPDAQKTQEAAPAENGNVPEASADGCSGFRPAYAECQDAMQQVRIFDSVVLGGGGELLALGDLRVGVGFDEIRRAVRRQPKIDARVAVEPQRLVDAFGGPLNA